MFIKSNNQAVSFDELSAFFRVVDADEDGRITYSELLEAVTFVPNYFGGSRQQPSSTIYSDL
jgi:Ca2+-binding EF-hand superfamily protein